jgi:protein-tyrosine phosphatase
MEKIYNFRDFGGYKTRDGHIVKKGLLYRSAGLNEASQADLNEMAVLGIHTVCDLRGESEQKEQPDRTFGGAEINRVKVPVKVNLHNARGFLTSLFSFRFGKGRQLDFGEAAREGYRAYASHFCGEFATIIRLASDSRNLPILIHCKAGKDRTGFSTSLILSLLGVPFEQVMEEYLKTNVYLREFREKTLKQLKIFSFFGFSIDNYLPLFDACPDYLQAAYDQINEEYGSLEEYAQKCLVLSDETLTRLKSILLD